MHDNIEVSEEKLKKELLAEKTEYYLQILENTETEMLYTALPEDIPNLIKTKGHAIVSLISLDYPYTCKNDLVNIVSGGHLYSIRMDYLLSLDESHSISLKDSNRIEDMLPSLFLHSTDIKTITALSESSSKEEISKRKTTSGKNKKANAQEEYPKAKNNQKASTSHVLTTPIASLAIENYCYNIFDLALVNNDGVIVAQNISITNYLLERSNNGEDKKHFITIVDTIGANQKHHKSVFSNLNNEEDKDDLIVPINLSSKETCNIRISFENIESLNSDINVSYDIDKNEGSAEIPSWKGILAFPYSIKSNSKGGVLVGRTKSGYELYQSDFKSGKITIKRTMQNGEKDVQFTVFLRYSDNKVILEMIDKSRNA